MRLGLDKDFNLRLEKDSLKQYQYNGLTDPNLASFFTSPTKRKLLMRQKLITPEGLVNEYIVRQNITQEYVLYPSSKKFSQTPLPMVSVKRYKSKEGRSDKSERSGRSTSRTKSKERQQKPNKIDLLPKLQPVSAEKFKEILLNRRKMFN